MNKEVKTIIEQGKEFIINSALKIIGSDFTRANFNVVKIKASNKEIQVSLLTPIKYLAINSAYYADIEVLLIEKGTTYHNYSNPSEYHEDKFDLPFYKETEEGKKNIQFVINAINKRAPFDPLKFEDNMIIRDHPEFYDISVDSYYTQSWYKINKLTGELFDEGHAHYVQPPTIQENQDEIFIDIN